MTNDSNVDYEPNFFKRLIPLAEDIILSYDTLGGIVAFFLVWIVTGGISESAGTEILSMFSIVSASLFALVLTGFTIITSFTDKLFLYAWQDIEEYENIITTFQYNLSLPAIVLLFSLALQVRYSAIASTVLIALFVYMVLSLLDLVGFIAKYALQRGEFVKQLIDRQIREDRSGNAKSERRFSDEELIRIQKQLNELERLKQDKD